MKKPKHPGAQVCPRCGNAFIAVWMKSLKKWSSFCGLCSCRNLHDALGFPTPPELLDPHSLNPALTKEEFQRKLKEMPE